MKVADYIAQCDLETTVLESLETLGVRGDIQVDILNALYDYTLKINSRAKSRFGAVKHDTKILELTSEFFDAGYTVLADRHEKHTNTLLHEVAHIIARILYPFARASHGAHWQRIMRALGQKPERTGNADFMKVAHTKKKAALGPKHEYRCLWCNFTYKTVRKLKNVASRYHGACGPINGRLDYTLLR